MIKIMNNEHSTPPPSPLGKGEIWRRGFLLFEVMVAVTVIGIGMASVLQAISQAVTTARAGRDSLQGNAALSQKLWEIESRRAVEPGVSEGIIGAGATEPAKKSGAVEFHYRVTIEEMFLEAPMNVQSSPKSAAGQAGQGASTADKTSGITQPRLAKVGITVSWDDRGKPRKLFFQTYMPVREEDRTLAPVTYIQ